MKLTGELAGDDGKLYPVTIEVGAAQGGTVREPIGTAVAAKATSAGEKLYNLSALVTPTDAVGEMFFDFTPADDLSFLVSSARVVLVNGVGSTSFIPSEDTHVVAQAHFVPTDETQYTRSSSQFITIPKYVPPVGTPAQLPPGANSVDINGVTLPVAGVDPSGTAYPAGRGPNELVIYTKPMAGTNVTGTNLYGFEVVVKDGKVIRTAGAGANVFFNVPEYVLSAHGTMATRLRTAATIGKPVFVSKAPVPSVPSVPDSHIPAWVVGGYWQQYQGPQVADLAPEYNLLWAAFALGMGGQQMRFAPVVQDVSPFKDQVKASQAKGCIWGISIGGGVNAQSQTFIRNKDEAQRVFDSIVPIIDMYGFQGLDDDLENGPSGFTYDGLAFLFEKLRNKYGNDFVLASTPRPYEDFRVDYAVKLYRAGLLDLLQWQFYDALEYLDADYLHERVISEIGTAAEKGVPYSAQIMGAITRKGYQYGWNKVEVYRDIAVELKAKGLRGAFIWETNMDKAEGWSFAKKIGALNT